MSPSAVPATTAVVLVCVVTVLLGAYGLRMSRTTSDFYVASRTVSPRWNASAIGGEYLSAASFLGVAGLVLLYGVDMLWFPVGYTAGYLALLALVAAPLRRSGAYTLPDFAELRLESTLVRRAAAVLVVGIGWLYLLPQMQGAGLALRTVTGLPGWVGGAVVAGVVVMNVVVGGMRSITLVQAFQYWLKLVAIAVPAFLLLAAWRGEGVALPLDTEWTTPLSGARGGDHRLYATYSTLLALFFGTMGLPHVLVRFYTNPDGRAARRTTLVVIALLGAFYLFPPVYGVLGRAYAPDLATAGRADSVVLLLPGMVLDGVVGDLAGALVAAGAFAAFLSTSSGLVVSVAGVLSQDLLRRHSSTVAGFRLAAVVAVVVPLVLSLAGTRVGLADTVGLAFAVAASTFCPLLVLGIWWRRLTTVGAVVGLVVGGGLATAAVLVTMLAPPFSGWWGTLLAQPAMWSVPAAFLAAVVASLLSPSRVPRHVGRTMVLLHAPEELDLDRGRSLRRG